jgi:hypothetical protein
MKRLILLAMLLLPMCVMAQDVTISSLMAEYSTKSKCSTINLSSSMLRSMGVEMGADELRAVSVANPELMPRFLEQVAVVVSGLNVVMSVNSDGQHSVSIYQRVNRNGSVTDLVIVKTDDKESVIMHIRGRDLELSKIDSLLDR